MQTTTILSTSLHYREGNSDKVYQASVEPKGDGYIVTFAYGRRGNTLNTGIKNDTPVPLETATKLFNKLVASKVAKGYQPDGEAAKPYQQSGDEGRDTGIRCQLLNPIEKEDVSRLLTGRTHCLQEKHDGRRLMVRKQGDEITGINRRGLVVAIPDAIREAVEHIPFDVLIDGEAVGDTLHAFDLLEVKGNDLRQRRYLDRFSGLIMVIPTNLPALRWVSTSIDPNDKVEIYEELRATNREGVVFKEVDAPYSAGRPNSGGTQLKYKFVESASFIVTARNEKRSVSLGLFDGNEMVSAGNVTIPPNHEIPAKGEVVECQYLYCFRESGSIYQPVYLGKRCDIPAAECSTDQLKYKVAAEDRLIHLGKDPRGKPASHDTSHSATGVTRPPWSIPKLHGGHLFHPTTNNSHQESMKIISATITKMPRPMPEGMFDPMPEVVATFEDGTTKRLFSFFPDEVSFQASEFAGLTEEEAHSLFQRKDTTYLPVMKQPIPTFTVFCQESGGTGTIHIASVEAVDLEAAIIAGKQQCIDDWSAGSTTDESRWNEETVHCLGIAAGNIEILHWEDQSE